MDKVSCPAEQAQQTLDLTRESPTVAPASWLMHGRTWLIVTALAGLWILLGALPVAD
jgi:hypothetical protein